MRELENALHEIVEKGRLLQSREELQLDQQDDMDERIYEMKRLLQQAEVRAERYEILIAELETILGKLEGMSKRKNTDHWSQRFKYWILSN